MAINKAMRAALKAISYPDPDITKTYRIVRQVESVTSKKIIMPRFCNVRDEKIPGTAKDIPVRIFSSKKGKPDGLILFFHGGGWVCGNIDTYTGVCTDMVKALNRTVLSVDYRLAPEFKFPAGLDDCYDAAYALFVKHYLPEFGPEDIVIMGDSAGGNLAAAVSLLARDRGDFLPRRQVLLYPSTYNDHSLDSPFPSIRDNGFDYLLTSKRIEGYIDLYVSSDDDRQSPYLAPLLAESLAHQPDTLIISAEFCPLRDEGEEYGKRLEQDGCRVRIYRMRDALHGFLSLPVRFEHVKKAYKIINEFLGGETDAG